MASTIHTIDLTCDEKNHKSLLATAKALVPSWKDFAFRRLAGGVNNTLVFTHCDLLAGNIVIRSRDGEDDSPEAVEQVDVIDFEYAMSAPAAFDIACHFSEWAAFECDYTLLPPRPLRRRFLMEYTSTYNSLRGPEGNTIDLDEMCAEVDRFRGVPGYMWGIAALVQAQVSTTDFDFNKYADLRIEEYRDWRAEMNGSREKSGKEMPLRERCWARED